MEPKEQAAYQRNVQLLEMARKGEIGLPIQSGQMVEEEIHEYRARDAFEKKVLARGWESWNRPHNFLLGVLEEPHFSSPKMLGFIIAVGLISAVMTSLSFTFEPHTALRNQLMFFGFILVGTFFISASIFQSVAESYIEVIQDNDAIKLNGKELKVRYYIGILPGSVWEKCRRDRGLFDMMYVASADPSLFAERITGVVTRTDPLLVGRTGDRFFVGAQWDLNLDIAQIGTENEKTV